MAVECKMDDSDVEDSNLIVNYSYHCFVGSFKLVKKKCKDYGSIVYQLGLDLE